MSNKLSEKARQVAERAKGTAYSIAATFDCQLYNVFWIEIDWIGRERRTTGMLHSLIHRQNANVSTTTEAAV
jgi:DNA-binding XRE family transcriptional regulator